jgi:hypothetical protein
MSRNYEAAVQKTTGAAAGIIACFVEPSGGRRATVMELGISATTAVAGEIALGLPGNTPSGTLTGTTVTPNDPGDETGTGVLVTSFATTQPTAPANNRRRFQLPAVIGAGIVWTWNEGELIVPVNAFNQGLLVWQLSSAAVTYDVYIKVKE